MSGLEITTATFLISGVIFFVGATVGILRLPDFFTRIHAASKGDTASSLLLLFGLGFLLAPAEMLNVYGTTSNPTGLLTARVFGIS